MKRGMQGILNDELYDRFCDDLWRQHNSDNYEADSVAEDWRTTQELAKVFKAHFEKFEPETKQFDYEWLAERFLCYASIGLKDIINVKKALDDLQELKRCWSRTKHLMDNLPRGVDEVMRHQALSMLSGYFGKPAPKDVKIQDLIAQCPQYSSFRVASAATDLLPYFLPVLDQTIEHIKNYSTPTGRKALDAWHVVDAAATVCDAVKETIKVPRRMGPSGDFYHLLVDLFAFCELEEDPVNVARNWAKYAGR